MEKKNCYSCDWYKSPRGCPMIKQLNVDMEQGCPEWEQMKFIGKDKKENANS